MANRKFNTVPVKNAIVPADVVIVVDSEDSNKLKQVPATAFKGADGAVGPQGPQGIPGTPGTGTVVSVVGGTNVSVNSTDPANPVVSLSLGADENFVTDAEKTKLANTSGTNTGNQTAVTVPFDPTGTTLSATEVQSALVELAAEKIQEPTNAYATGYVLTWNGTDWVGQENTPAVGSASKFYLDATATLADNLALSTSPSTFPETTISVSADASIGGGVSFLERFVSGPLGRTIIPAGNWDFSTFGSVSAVTGANSLHTRINRRSELTGMTATFTGTGTTRTLTVTGGTPFVAGDANASVLAATLVETPNQTCWISGFTSSSVVTVTLTDAGYVNETNTPLSALYYRLFLASSADIATTGIQEFTYSTTQPEFTGLNPTDRIVAAYFAQTDSGTARTFTLYYGGTARFSSFLTPLTTRHNDLAGLNEGDYLHLTANEKTVVSQLEPIGTASQQIRVNAGGTALEYFTPSGGGGGPSPILTYSSSGVAIAGKVASVRLSQACTFSKLAISLGVLPVGGNFEVNIKKNGTTILSGNLTITTSESASNSYYTVITGDSGKATIATTAAVAEDVITCEIIAGSGNTFLGSDVNILLTGTLS